MNNIEKFRKLFLEFEVATRKKVGNDRLNLDVKYVKIKSLLLDLKILFKTFVIVFKRDGAL